MASEGHTQAQFSLAFSYEYGLGRDQDSNKATALYLQAAQQGHAQAMYRLGLTYLTSQESQAEIKLTIEWWQKAAEKGFATAQFHLGIAYYIGLGVKQNVATALKWITNAQANGYAQSKEFMTMLAIKHAQLLVAPVHSNNNTLIATKIEGGKYDKEVRVTNKQDASVTVEATIPVFAAQNIELNPFTALNDPWMIKVIEKHGDWLKIRSNSQFPAWIFGKHVGIRNSTLMIASDNVRLRPLPSTGSESPPIGLLAKGDVVVVLETQGDWKKIVAPLNTLVWIRASDFNPATKEVVKRSFVGEQRTIVQTDDKVSGKSVINSASPVTQPSNINASIIKQVETKSSVYRINIPVYANRNIELEPFSRFTDEQHIDVVEDQGAWLKVRSYVQLLVWVFGQYVDSVDNTTNIANNNVRLRPLPSTGPESPSIGLLAKGDAVVVFETRGDWKRIVAPLSTEVWIRASDYKAAN